MATHRIMLETPILADCAADCPELVVGGEEAKHAARVKRLGEGDLFEALDGMGVRVMARIERVTKDRKGEWWLVARATELSREPRVHPVVEVLGATPKGGRLEDMIDQLSQVGASAWRPLLAARTTVDPREGKLARLSRTASESAKQCGRAWYLRVDEAISFAQALAPDEQSQTRIVLAEASGISYIPGAHERVRLLIGPEGGWTDEEIAEAERCGVSVCSFGRHAMRIETAAVVACGIIMERAAGR